MNSGQDQAGADFLFDVFISYRHGGEDQKIAEELHKRLETFRTPKTLVAKGAPHKLKRVFRDRDELPVSSDLTANIVEALQQSRFLVVICSPRVPESRWIREEIRIFRALGRGGHIMPILIEGEPKDSFPPELIERQIETVTAADGKRTEIEREKEPIAADVRAETHAQRLKLLKTEIFRILAPVLGCKFDDLRQREQERARRRLIAASAVLGITAAGFAGLAGFAGVQYFAAKEQRQVAEKERLAAVTSQSRIMARVANDRTAAGDTGTALHIAIEAILGRGYDASPPLVPEVHDAFYRALAAHRIVRSIRSPDKKARRAIIDPQGARVAITYEDGATELLSIRTGEKLNVAALAKTRGEIVAVQFSDGGDRMAVALTGGKVQIYDGSGQKLIGEESAANCNVTRLWFRPAGDRLVFECSDRSGFAGIGLIDSVVGKWIDTPPVAEAYSIAANGSILAFMGERNGEISILDLATGRLRKPIQFRTSDGFENVSRERLSVSADGEQVAISGNQEVRIFEVKSGRVVDQFRGSQWISGAIQFVPAVLHLGKVLGITSHPMASILGDSFETKGITPFKAFDIGDNGNGYFFADSLFAVLTGNGDEQSVSINSFNVGKRGRFISQEVGRLFAVKESKLEASKSRGLKPALTAAIRSDGSVDIVSLPEQSVPEDAGSGDSIYALSPGKKAIVKYAAAYEVFQVYDPSRLLLLREFGIEQFAHVGMISGMAVSDDGGELVVVTNEGDASVYDVTAKAPRLLTKSSLGKINSGVRAAPDGWRAAVLRSGVAELINLKGGKTTVRRNGTPQTASSIELSADGRHFAVATETDVFIAQVEEGSGFNKITAPLQCIGKEKLELSLDQGLFVVRSGSTRWSINPATGATTPLSCGNATNDRKSVQISTDEYVVDRPMGNVTLAPKDRYNLKAFHPLALVIEPFGLSSVDRLEMSGTDIHVRVASDEAIKWFLAVSSECLPIAKRRELGLDPAPPAYCIESGRPPFASAAWKTWLAAKRRGESPPLPEQ